MRTPQDSNGGVGSSDSATVLVKGDTTSPPAGSTADAKLCCFSLRYASLVMLVLQNCAAVLLMRYTQTRVVSVKYSVSSVVASTELVKVIVCLYQMVRNEDKSIRECIGDCLKPDGLKMVVPAALYTLQNNLLFVALANLEATLFQVTYQLKLLVTALFMVVLLNKKLSMYKWSALGVLFIGIVFTQLKGSSSSKKDVSSEQLVQGLLAVVVCATSSAFASVYFEKVVKNTQSSLASRNVQLGCFSGFFAMCGFFYAEKRGVSSYLDGYDAVVMILVMNQAVGGILVAVVIKYADNILKGFATAIAIIVSGVISYLFLDFAPTTTFMFGASLVIAAVGMYAREDPPPTKPKGAEEEDR